MLRSKVYSKVDVCDRTAVTDHHDKKKKKERSAVGRYKLVGASCGFSGLGMGGGEGWLCTSFTNTTIK